MDYTIYTYGGSEIMWKCLNSIAMMGSSGFFTKVGHLMIGIGLLSVAARVISVGSFPLLLKKWIAPTFLLLAFFWGPKVTVNLVDHVDTNFKAAQVANVPLGIAFAASFSTRMSNSLTEIVEKFVTSSDMEKFSKVGPMFAARLNFEARKLTIKDPIMRQNIKDFTSQCYMWPFIFTNIVPGKKAAQESEDILGFIQKNAHKSLGMYWRQDNGQAKFMFCSACASKVKEAISLEVETGFQSIARKMFGASQDGLAETVRLKQYFGDAWSFLAKGSSDTAQIIQQELMLNSYRAALQDKRDEFNLPRNPALSYLNAERGQVQQDESFLVKAALSGTQVPSLHTLLLCFALLFFAIVAPFTFINGGTFLILTFGKVMLWLATWPPLFAVLNALGHMFLAKAGSWQTMGYGEGLNLMTQTGLAESAYHTYAFIMGLQYSVPFLSWALLSGGAGYAMSQLSSFLTQSGESFASKAGAEMVDGNVTFDSQTLHYKSVANTQMAQQQLAPNINYGSRVDDGKTAKLYGPQKDGEMGNLTDRQVTYQQHLTQLGTSLAKNDGLTSSLITNSLASYSAGLTHTKQAGEQAQTGVQQMYSLIDKISKNESLMETFGKSENGNVSKDLSDVINQVKQFASDNKISEASAFQAHVRAAISGNVGASLVSSGLGTILNALGGSIGVEHTTAGQKVDDHSKRVSNDASKNFSDKLGNVLSFMSDNKGSISEAGYHEDIGQIQESYNKSKFHSEQAAASYQLQKVLSEAANVSRQMGVSSNTNINDDLLKKVADERHGGNVDQAVAAIAADPNILSTAASVEISNARAGLTPASMGSKASIKKDYDVYSQSIKEAPKGNEAVEKGMAKITESQNQIKEKVESEKRVAEDQQRFIEAESNKKAELKKNYEDHQKEFSQENEKSTPGIVGRRLIGQ